MLNIVSQFCDGISFGIGVSFVVVITLIIADKIIAIKDERSKQQYLKEKRKKKRDKQRSS